LQLNLYIAGKLPIYRPLRSCLPQGGNEAMNTVRKVEPPPSKSGEVDAFLNAVKKMPTSAANGQGRLIFAMDATMSRQPTWDSAQSIQGQMFMEAKKVGGLGVQLMYFRGFNECKASRWVNDPEALAMLMTKVDCRGGNTQISKVLAHVKTEAAKAKVNAVIFVGDACEENVDALCQSAGEIGLLGLPVFMFQEGTDAVAERAFKEIAKLTRGAYFRLDAGSPRVLAELLGAVAAYAAGGKKALEGKSGQTARALLQQLK
jgi:hypothetical protein